MKVDERQIICFLVAIMALVPSACGVTFSVSSNAGNFAENLGTGISDVVKASSVITDAGIIHTMSGTSPAKTLDLKEKHGKSNTAGAHAEVGVDVENAASYHYDWALKTGEGDNIPVVRASQDLDVSNADRIQAYAKAYNQAGRDVTVSTNIANGNLAGYTGLAQADPDMVQTYQAFITADGSIQLDGAARTLTIDPDKRINDKNINTFEANGKLDATISTTATSVANYIDGAVMTSQFGTQLEQTGNFANTFESTSKAEASSKTVTSDPSQGSKLDMKASISQENSWVPTATGMLTSGINDGSTLLTDLVLPGSSSTTTATTTTTTATTSAVTAAAAAATKPKVVLIRADDVWYFGSPGYLWTSNLVWKNNIAATYAVVPYYATQWMTPLTTNTYNLLNKDQFELATHGYKHEDFKGMSYTKQLNLMTQGTNLMTKYMYKPTTFVAPYDDLDVNTLKAAKALGYHSVCGQPVTGRTAQSVGIDQYGIDLYWEDWDNYPGTGDVGYITLPQFKTEYDAFLSNSAQQYFCIEMHPNDFWTNNGDGSQRTKETDQFQAAIDYMKSKGNVQFKTVEQEYKINHP